MMVSACLMCKFLELLILSAKYDVAGGRAGISESMIRPTTDASDTQQTLSGQSKCKSYYCCAKKATGTWVHIIQVRQDKLEEGRIQDFP